MDHYNPNNNSDVSGLNQALVEELKSKGYICTPQVEGAFRTVPRHLFVPGVPLENVYADRALSAKKDQDGRWLSSSSQPAIMAIMLEQLDLQPGHKVLEIGTGTGFNAALMAHIVGETGHVVTVDIEEGLVEAAREHLAVAGFDRVQVICTDGGYGYLEAAPYDRIILTVGASDIAPAWLAQMKPDGRLVLPLAISGQTQQSIAFERNDDHLISRSIHDCGFIQLRDAFAPTPVIWVSLGPEPGLSMATVEEHPVDVEQVYAWLTGPSRDWKTGVEVALRDVFSGLGLWLSLHGLEGHGLVARGDMVDRDIVPPLVSSAGFGGEPKSVSTGVLLGEGGLAALTRPPGQSAPLAETVDPCVFDSSFSLYVRQFGSAKSLAQRLVEEIRAWDAARRPSTQGLRVQAYPKDIDYALSAGELVVEKELTRLVLDWSESAKGDNQ